MQYRLPAVAAVLLSLAAGPVVVAQPAGALRPCADQPADSPGACSGRPLDYGAAPRLSAQISLPQGVVNQPYAAARLTYGGEPPYAARIVGSLPSGLAVADDGVLTGTPTQAGDFAFSLIIRDSSLPPNEDRRSFRLRIRAGGN
jgi:hypothetical protein